jgi:hypothetical protein
VHGANATPEAIIKLFIKQITVGLMIYIFSFIISIFVKSGIINYCVNLVKLREAPSPGTLLIFDIRILNFLIFSILYNLLMIVVTAALAVPSITAFVLMGKNENNLPIALTGLIICFFLLMLIYIILSVYFVLSPYLVIDKYKNPIEAFTKSVSMMRGNAFEMLLLLILLGAINVGVALTTLLLGLLFTTPFNYVVMANAYKKIVYPESEENNGILPETDSAEEENNSHISTETDKGGENGEL